MSLAIMIDDLSDGAIADLLNSHLQDMHKYSPPESIHALDSEKLKDPAVTFWAARIDGELAGCGALKELAPLSGEIKSMKTAAAHIRKGVAASLLTAIIQEASRRGYTSLYLETGTNDAFQPAIALYHKHGFIECGPFGDYALDPYSLFMTRSLI